MGRHPLVTGAGLAAVLLFACSRTHPAETMSAIRSLTPHAAAGMELAAPRLLAPGSHAPAATSAGAPAGAPLPASSPVASARGRSAAGCPPITPAIIAARVAELREHARTGKLSPEELRVLCENAVAYLRVKIRSHRFPGIKFGKAMEAAIKSLHYERVMSGILGAAVYPERHLATIRSAGPDVNG